MTVWRYSISWSKFKLALECPLALQNTIDKKPPDHEWPNYYMVKGNVVQKVFEEYFNQRVNLHPGGDTQEVLQKVVDRILMSTYYKGLTITYPDDIVEEDLHANVRHEVANGLEIFRSHKILHKRIRSEVKWNAVFRGFRMFAMMDFKLSLPGGIGVYDGKGHKKKNADPNQLLYYALALIAGGKKVKEAGLIYWNHGYDPVNVSPKAIRVFIDEKLDKVRPIFEQLKAGVDVLSATPSDDACGYCPWKFSCEFSTKRRPEVPSPTTEYVGFDDNSV